MITLQEARAMFNKASGLTGKDSKQLHIFLSESEHQEFYDSVYRYVGNKNINEIKKYIQELHDSKSNKRK